MRFLRYLGALLTFGVVFRVVGQVAMGEAAGAGLPDPATIADGGAAHGE